MNTSREDSQFRKFREEVKKFDIISTDNLWQLMMRFTQGNMGRRFFNQKAKLNYYKFWIKRLHLSNMIQETGAVGLWKVNKDVTQ